MDREQAGKNEMDNKSELNTIATHQKLLYINIHFASVASLTETTWKYLHLEFAKQIDLFCIIWMHVY